MKQNNYKEKTRLHGGNYCHDDKTRIAISGGTPSTPKIKSSGLLIALFIILFPSILSAQSEITFDQFMQKVYEKNIGYAVEQLNVNIADASITSAKVFEDPFLSIEYGYNEDKVLMMGQGLSGELSKTFTFGKRSAAIDLATSEKALSEALLADYLRNLRAEAASVYYYSLFKNKVLEVQKEAYQHISRLASGDSLRFAIGDISEIDAIQSNLEAGMSANEVRQASIEAFSSTLDMSMMFGSPDSEYEYYPNGELIVQMNDYPLSELILMALDNRADLAAAMQDVDVANKALTVVRRERRTDIDVAMGVNYNTRVRNEEAPAPPYTGVTVGMSIPLKFSNINKGAIRSEEFKIRQAEKKRELAELTVRNDVLRAYNEYLTNIEKVHEYDAGMLEKAKTVIGSKTTAYSKGNCSLLEVLNALRTYDDIRLRHLEALYDVAISLVELEKAVGYKL